MPTVSPTHPPPPPLSSDRDALATMLSMLPIDEHILCASVCKTWHAASCDPTAWGSWNRRLQIHSLQELENVPPRFRPFVRRMMIAMMDISDAASSDTDFLSQLLTAFSGVNELIVRDAIALKRFLELQQLDRPFKKLRMTELSQLDHTLLQLLGHPRLRSLVQLSLIKDKSSGDEVSSIELLPQPLLPASLRSLEILPCSLSAASLSFFLPCTQLRTISLAFPSGSNLVSALLRHLMTLEHLKDVSVGTSKGIAPDVLQELCQNNRSQLQWQAAHLTENLIIRIELLRLAPQPPPKSRVLHMHECHPGDPVFAAFAHLFPLPQQLEVRHVIPRAESAAFWGGVAAIGASLEVAEINTYGGILLDDQGVAPLGECTQLRRLHLNGGFTGDALAAVVAQLPHLTSLESDANALQILPTVIPLLATSKSLKMISFRRGPWVLLEVNRRERELCEKLKSLNPELSIWYDNIVVTDPDKKVTVRTGARRKCVVQ